MIDLHDAGATVKYLIRDRDSRYTAAFNAVLHTQRITTRRPESTYHASTRP